MIENRKNKTMKLNKKSTAEQINDASKTDLVAFAMELGIVRSKTEGKGILIAALRELVTLWLRGEANFAQPAQQAQDTLANLAERVEIKREAETRLGPEPSRHAAVVQEPKRLSSGARTTGELRARQEARRRRNKVKHKARLGRRWHSSASGLLPNRALRLAYDAADAEQRRHTNRG